MHSSPGKRRSSLGEHHACTLGRRSRCVGGWSRGAGPIPASSSEPAALARSRLGELHAVNILEIELGTLAQARAGDLQVKRFGENLARAHTKMDSKGNECARKYHLTVTPPPEDPEHQLADEAHAALKQRLRELKGADFDRAYLQAMAEGHGQVLEKLTAWEAQAQDKNLRAFISDASREVAAHRQQANDLVTQLGRSASL